MASKQPLVNYRFKGQFYNFVGFLMIATGIVELGYEAIFWLRFGYAAHITNGFVINYMLPNEPPLTQTVSWAGVLAIIDWLGRQQFGFTIFVLGIFFCWWGNIHNETAKEIEEHRRIFHLDD